MKKRMMHIRSSMEDFLKEEGILEETRAVGAERDARLASSASDGEGQNQQGRNGAALEHKPRGVGSPSRSSQYLGDAANPKTSGTLSAVICASRWLEWKLVMRPRWRNAL